MNEFQKRDLWLRKHWLSFSMIGVAAGIGILAVSGSLGPDIALAYLAGFVSGGMATKGIFMAFMGLWGKKDGK